MKIKFLIPVLIFSLAIVFNSCKKEVFDPVLEITTATSFISPQSGAFTLADDIADNTFATFVWTEAEYNVDIMVSYTLEIDIAANNFSEPYILTTTANDSFAITVFDFNKALTKEMGITPGEEIKMSVRVGSHGAASEKVYSETISMTVTPYDPPFAPEQLYVISGGETVGTLMPTNENGDYEGYFYIEVDGSDFILSDAEADGTILGDIGADAILDFDGDAIAADSSYYKININTFSMSYTLAAANWGIIGSAIPPYDWSEDIDMTYADGLWSITLDVATGMFKFRANDEWADGLVYGDYAPIDGILDDEPGGGDIPIDAGNYTFTIDLRLWPYTYTAVAN